VVRSPCTDIGLNDLCGVGIESRDDKVQTDEEDVATDVEEEQDVMEVDEVDEVDGVEGVGEVDAGDAEDEGYDGDNEECH
jgi:hypothetical protein